MVGNLQFREPHPGRLIICAIVVGAAMAGGCARRTMVEDEVAAAQRAPPSPPPAYAETRQGIGAPDPVWMDDPSKRRGPQGQPAPYGRDTVTGKPLTDLQGQPGAGDRPAGFPAVPGNGNRVAVAKGDTLSAIAKRHNVSVDSLRIANDLRADRITAGQTLIIPGR